MTSTEHPTTVGSQAKERLAELLAERAAWVGGPPRDPAAGHPAEATVVVLLRSFDLDSLVNGARVRGRPCPGRGGRLAPILDPDALPVRQPRQPHRAHTAPTGLPDRDHRLARALCAPASARPDPAVQTGLRGSSGTPPGHRDHTCRTPCRYASHTRRPVPAPAHRRTGPETRRLPHPPPPRPERVRPPRPPPAGRTSPPDPLPGPRCRSGQGNAGLCPRPPGGRRPGAAPSPRLALRHVPPRPPQPDRPQVTAPLNSNWTARKPWTSPTSPMTIWPAWRSPQGCGVSRNRSGRRSPRRTAQLPRTAEAA